VGPTRLAYDRAVPSVGYIARLMTRLMAGAGEIIWEARTQELERELNEVKNSTSWKITRPLRRLRGSREKGK